MKKIALLLVFLLVLTGCGAKEESPEQAVTNALTAVKNLDKETAQKYFTYDNLFSSSDGSEQKVLDNQENVKLIVKNLKFKVISSSINGNEATVKTEITNTDMKAVISEYLKQAMAFIFSSALSTKMPNDAEMEKQTEQMLIDLLKKDGNTTVTSTVDIKLTKGEGKDEGWKLNMDQALQSALLGGISNSSLVPAVGSDSSNNSSNN